MKKILLAIVLAVFVLAGCTIKNPEKEDYRNIKVFKLEGSAEVIRNDKSLEPYEQMVLRSNDEISVGSSSNLILVLDDNKYVLLSENTKINLISSEKDSSKTVISLKEGKIVTEVKEKLKDGETFEVETPNSVMAIRGTTFSVEVDKKDSLFEIKYQLVKGSVDLYIFDNVNDSVVVNKLEMQPEEAVTMNVHSSAVIDGKALSDLKDEVDSGEITANTFDSVDDYVDSSADVSIKKAEYEDSDFDEVLDLSNLNYRILSISSSFEVVGTNIKNEHLYESANEFKVIVTADTLENKEVDYWLVNDEKYSVNSNTIEIDVKSKIIVEPIYKDKDLACEHDFQIEIVESTCTVQGTETLKCTKCGEVESVTLLPLKDHSFGDWYPSQVAEDKHERACNCGEREYEDCTYDEGKVTKEPSHFEEGIKTYTCTVCGRTKEEVVEKTEGHDFSDWYPSQEAEDKHERACNCGEREYEDCTYDEGKVTKEPNHFEEGIITYTCTVCGRTKEEVVEKIEGHDFSDWYPSYEVEDKHQRACNCGETEMADCTYDEGKVTKEPSHFEEGIITYTCTVCGRTKEEVVEKTERHEFGDWYPSQVAEDKHERACNCGEKEYEDCTYDSGTNDEENGLIIYTCTVCGREKEEIMESVDGIIIVISSGTATFEGKETVTSDSDKYGENANVYIAQENDVLNVSLTEQAGRTFKYWVSGTGTIIPDAEFSMLVFRSGYYYPVFEDTDLNEFSSRQKIFEGNCEEGILYMSTNSKGDVKYELEFENGGHHDFYDRVPYNSQYHKYVCTICGESIYEEHMIYNEEVAKVPTHSEEGLIEYECSCGYKWTEILPVTDEHSVDYDNWHIVEESKNGEYGKYRVYCKYCDYYEEYWYLGGQDLIGFMENKMINYQYTYGGKVCHDEYYYSYRNAEGQKVYIWAIQYESERTSNADYKDTYIFMYLDDEDSATIEPIYLSKSRGDRRAEYLWAVYGYAYDVNDWIKTLDSPDFNIGCGNGMTLSNSMSARSSVFESYHNEWAETYNRLRIPTSKEYNDLSDTSWEISYEGKAFQGGYYDENDEYVSTGGRDIISYVKDFGTSYQKYMHVDKETGITYGYEDWGTSYRTIFIMRSYKEIVSPEEYEALDEAGKSVTYSYGNIENDIKSLCSKRNLFNNFTLKLPETITSFRFLFGDYSGNVEVSGSNTSIYYNSAQVYNSGDPITLTWQESEDLVFDRYEIWDFESQKWVTLSESSTFIFNTSDNPIRDASYVRVIYHKDDTPIEPGETYRVTVENGYFFIDGEEYTGTIEVASGSSIYIYSDYIDGKTFDYWQDSEGNQYYNSEFTINSDMILTAIYTDALYNIYVSGWDYESYVNVNGGELSYTAEFEGKIGDTFELSTSTLPEGECTVFIGWYIEKMISGSWEYIFLSDSQTFTYTIAGNESGGIYAAWTTGENPFVKTYVDIRVVNGFVLYAGGEAAFGAVLDNAYSVISLGKSGMINIYDDPSDETVYTTWDFAFRYELEGEINHDIRESYQDEYDFYPVDFWVDDPDWSYPDGVINVTGIVNNIEEGTGEIVPSPAE